MVVIIKSYESLNDYELLDLIQEKNEDAERILYEKYRKVIELKVKKNLKLLNPPGLEFNDLVQEGMIGLSQAINDYKDHKNVRFSTFANLCIEREILTAITSLNRKKHKILNESLSLDSNFADGDNSYLELIADKKSKNPEKLILDEERMTEFKKNARKILTRTEYMVFCLKIEGFDYKKIAKILGKTPKSVDNTLQRIKRKLKNIKITS